MANLKIMKSIQKIKNITWAHRDTNSNFNSSKYKGRLEGCL